MKVYDCFSFFNELDLLELRLNELDAVVDYFVLVEATRTFQNKPKPLYYQENIRRFEKFHSKIKHVVVDDFPSFWSKLRPVKAWDFDNHQKDQVSRALTACAPDDVIIFSDLDEIPDPAQILAYKAVEGVKVFQQKHFYYFMNCVEVELENKASYKWWYGPVMTHFKNFKSVQKLRVQREIHRHPHSIIIPNGGWHFAYLGGVEKIILKLESYAHTEHNRPDFKDPARIKQIIESGQSLYGDNMTCVFQKIDETYPAYLVRNIDLYKAHIFEL